MSKKINKGWYIGGAVALVGIVGIIFLTKKNKDKKEESAKDLSDGSDVPTGSNQTIDVILSIALQLFDRYIADKQDLTQSEANGVATKIANLKIQLNATTNASRRTKIQSAIDKGIATLTKFGYKLDEQGKAVKAVAETRTIKASSL